MINKDRVRTMTRLAIYEEGQGVADDKMNGYFKNDYIVGHMVGFRKRYDCLPFDCVRILLLPLRHTADPDI